MFIYYYLLNLQAITNVSEMIRNRMIIFTLVNEFKADP
ncbi:hypothetical protein MgSA37_01711 [Mucilaginibacter gotjawali]|uniref:Uncharacterized protein n=2 Tax=Mucilaginibacter gotjawali TaxID=1550579 RepID=A0A0X8X0F1_9SPHI|nr:hypothetical protein [Mucilaginibacter gotjawali]BAU53542.1 hypothetical protein MgSA37_01711 [Mucilaginibacter gotjawali]